MSFQKKFTPAAAAISAFSSRWQKPQLYPPPPFNSPSPICAFESIGKRQKSKDKYPQRAAPKKKEKKKLL